MIRCVAAVIVVASCAVAHAWDDVTPRARAIVEAELARAYAHSPIDSRRSANGYRWTIHDAQRVGEPAGLAEVSLGLLHESVVLTCTGFRSEPTIVRVDVGAAALVGTLDTTALHELAAYMEETFEVARRVAEAGIRGRRPTLFRAALYMPSGVSDSWTLTFRRRASEWTARVEVPSGKLLSLDEEVPIRGKSSGM